MKRSVNDIGDWSGWSDFLELYNKHKEAPYPDTSRVAFLLLFQGGFRASEAITIKGSQCRFNDEAVVIEHAPVLKKKNETYRNVVIRLDERNPLGCKFVDVIKEAEGDYLFPKHTKFYRNVVPGVMSTRRTLYSRVNEVGGLFPHSLRAYRAMMLVAERGFSVQDLMKWFEWSNADMAVRYTRTRDIAARMGIKNLPI